MNNWNYTGPKSDQEVEMLYGDRAISTDSPEFKAAMRRFSRKTTSSYVHVLKSWSMFFIDILSGERTSDIRWTGDRRFHVGDTLILKEFDPVKQEHTGREQKVLITYIQQNKSNPCAISREALADDYAVLSIRKV